MCPSLPHHAEFENLRWQDVVSQFVQGRAGLPLGYVDSNGVHTNPSPDAICSGEGVITLIKDASDVTRETIEACLRKCVA